MGEEEEQMVIPEDLHSLYMMGRAQISMGLTFFQLYHKYLSLIDIGKEMLPLENEDLRKEAEALLSSKDTYPETRQMEMDNSTGCYRLGPSTNKTGLVEVRKEDILVGLNEVDNQQATTLIPKIKKLDTKIFSALIQCGIIDVKSSSIEDRIEQALMDGGYDEDLIEDKEKDKKEKEDKEKKE